MEQSWAEGGSKAGTGLSLGSFLPAESVSKPVWPPPLGPPLTAWGFCKSSLCGRRMNTMQGGHCMGAGWMLVLAPLQGGWVLSPSLVLPKV